jgi:cytochrome c oxidase subunit 4
MNASPKKIYLSVWIALLVLLALTWGLAEVNLGPFNNIAALGIAAIKMLLVVLFFMHVRHESKLTWVFVAAGLIWLIIMVDLTMSDYLTRGDVPGKRDSWRHSEQYYPAREPTAKTEADK